MQAIIIHLDMNSYFASVEQQDNPDYRNKVLGVCEHLGGIIIAASIEAKKWGIKTGTPVWEAKKIYPKIILVHTRAEAYRKYHRLFLKVLQEYSNFVEPASIDEAYADITRVCNIVCHPGRGFGRPGIQLIDKNLKKLDPGYPRKALGSGMTGTLANPWEEAVKIAEEIKRRMKKEVGDYLTCSIGIAENKLLAKIASDMKKPDGIVVIQKSKVKIQNSGALSFTQNDLYNKLKLTDIPGIAKRQEKRLNDLGIKSLRDLRDYPLSKLAGVFGINGYHLYNMGRLENSWKPKVEHDQIIKSIGHMYTLPKEYRKKEFFEPVLFKLCEMVTERLRRKKLMGNIVIAYVRDGQYNSFGHSVKISDNIFDAKDLFLESRQIINSYPDISNIIANCKLIGVTVAGLKPFILQQSLFKKQTNKSALMSAVDVINAKYGKFTLSYTPVLKAGKVFRDSVGFGRVKEVGSDSDTSIRPGKSFKR